MLLYKMLIHQVVCRIQKTAPYQVKEQFYDTYIYNFILYSTNFNHWRLLFTNSVLLLHHSVNKDLYMVAEITELH